MPKISPLRPEHVAAIKLRQTDTLDLAGVDLKEYGHTLAAAQDAITIFTDNDEIIACMGGLTINSKSRWVFLLTSDLVDRYPLLLVKVVKKFMQRGMKLGIVRFETLVNTADERAVRFIEHLGFEREGLCRATGEDLTDRYLYAHICLGR